MKKAFRRSGELVIMCKTTEHLGTGATRVEQPPAAAKSVGASRSMISVSCRLGGRHTASRPARRRIAPSAAQRPAAFFARTPVTTHVTGAWRS